MTEQLILKGTLEGHSGWVTSLATSLENPNMLLSGSRDKTLIIWNLTRDETSYGYPKRSLHGHSHIVSDCVGCAGNGGATRIIPIRVIAETIELGYILRRCLRSLSFLGQNSPPLGALHRFNHPPVRWTHQRCSFRLFLCR